MVLTDVFVGEWFGGIGENSGAIMAKIGRAIGEDCRSVDCCLGYDKSS